MNIQQFQSELFKILKARFDELGFDAESLGAEEAGPQVGGTLLFLLPITENDDRALTDLRLVAIGENKYYVQIFMTLFTELENGYDELEKALSALNYYAGLGTYGMLEAKREFYHKYCFLLRELDLIDGAQGFALALLDALDIIREQTTKIYPIASALASGALSYESALSGGLIRAL
jgi:hypothetical protein